MEVARCGDARLKLPRTATSLVKRTLAGDALPEKSEEPTGSSVSRV